LALPVLDPLVMVGPTSYYLVPAVYLLVYDRTVGPRARSRLPASTWTRYWYLVPVYERGPTKIATTCRAYYW